MVYDHANFINFPNNNFPSIPAIRNSFSRRHFRLPTHEPLPAGRARDRCDDDDGSNEMMK